MKQRILFATLLFLFAIMVLLPQLAMADSISLARYPHLHDDQLIFSYQGDLWKMILKGTSNPIPLTTETQRDVVPLFSPDGGSIAFNREVAGVYQVFVMPSAGGIPVQRTFDSNGSLLIGWENPEHLFITGYRGDYPPRSNLFVLPKTGGPAVSLFDLHGSYVAAAPDARQFAFHINRPNFYRKGYRGPSDTDIWIYTPDEDYMYNLTSNDRDERFPMWASDGMIYFTKDTSSQSNLFKMDPKTRVTTQLTNFQEDDVQYPRLATDGTRIIFEQNHQFWIYSLQDESLTHVEIPACFPQLIQTDTLLDLNGEVDAFSIAPTSMRVCIERHGELFVTALSEGDTIPLTNSTARDKNSSWAPDGSKIAYISDRSDGEQVWLVDLETKTHNQLTFRDTLKHGIKWAPDSKQLLSIESQGQLFWIQLESNIQKKVVQEPRGFFWGDVEWSPDSKWIVYNAFQEEAMQSIYLHHLERGEILNVTEHPSNNIMPRFSKDGSHLVFLSNRNNSNQIYILPLFEEESDPFDAELRIREAEDTFREQQSEPSDTDELDDDRASSDESDQSEGEQTDGEADKEAEVEESFSERLITERLPYRVRMIPSVQTPIHEVFPSNHRDVIYLLTHEPKPEGQELLLFEIDYIGENQTLLLRTPHKPTVEETPDGSKLVYQMDNRLYQFPLDTKQASPVSYQARMQYDIKDEWLQMFNEAHRMLKHYFYDETMNGIDWDAMGSKYRQWLQDAFIHEDVLFILNELFGELQSSHLAAYKGKPRPLQTPYLGFDVYRDAFLYYRVGMIDVEGPADKEYINIETGDYILRVNGVPIRTVQSWAAQFQEFTNTYVDMELSKNPEGEESWNVRIPVQNMGVKHQLVYKHWVESNRSYVVTHSEGRLGYMHLASMMPWEIQRFHRQLNQAAGKEALIIDVRWNVGGNIDPHLIDVFEREVYQIMQYRDFKPLTRPVTGFFGPKAVLINSHSFSDAEVFPQAFKDRELGILIGEPTAGGVIFTFNYPLIDGTMIRLPTWGTYRLTGQDLERNPVQPDIYVVNCPSDEALGIDSQLDVAIDYLLAELDSQTQ